MVILRRLLALMVDWFIAMAISAGFFQNQAWVTLLIFFVMRTILISTLGTTIGKRLVGLGVRRVDDAMPGLGAAVVRTLLLCLLVPATVTQESTGRGLHDVWAGTHHVDLRGTSATRT